MTAFYVICATVCSARLVEYLYIVIAYNVNSSQVNTDFVLAIDIISSDLMVYLGVILILKLVVTTLAFQKNLGIRQTMPPIPLLICVPIALVTLVILAVLVFKFEWTFYALAIFQLLLAIGLFLSLYFTFSALSRFPLLRNFEGKKIAQYFVRIFSIAYLISSAANFLKAVYFNSFFLKMVTSEPVWFAVESSATDLLTITLPILLMFHIHRRNF